MQARQSRNFKWSRKKGEFCVCTRARAQLFASETPSKRGNLHNKVASELPRYLTGSQLEIHPEGTKVIRWKILVLQFFQMINCKLHSARQRMTLRTRRNDVRGEFISRASTEIIFFEGSQWDSRKHLISWKLIKGWEKFVLRLSEQSRFKYFIKLLVQHLLNILRENSVVTLRVLPERRKLNNLKQVVDGGKFISIILIGIKSGN